MLVLVELDVVVLCEVEDADVAAGLDVDDVEVENWEVLDGDVVD